MKLAKSLALILVGCFCLQTGILGEESRAPSLIPVALPRNGEVTHYAKEELLAPLRINSSTSHAFVKLTKVGSRIPVLTMFVRAGQSAETDAPLGTYEVKHATGQTRYGEEELFGPETDFNQAQTILHFKKIPTLEGYEVSGSAITLYKVRNGNLDTKKIKKEDF